MNALVDRVNRVVLFLIGLLLAAAGGVGLAAANGQLDLDEPGQLYREAVDDVVDQRVAWATGALTALAILAILGLVWAWRQMAARADGPALGTVNVHDTPMGRTTVEPVAVARALARDLETVDGVTGAKVRVLEVQPQPHIVASVDLDAKATPAAVRAGVEEPIARACQVLAVPEMAVDLRLNPSDTQPPRVL